ncbi:Crp/Fnr family transcriptional regulator [Flaviaesturariibacter aridisoli]|uniref:Crp/Fnr family transcriptional regulator n=1 Tax=Flaviaesturariibacter aridisoli TaxID=2545761 RepID=A0A4V2WNC8_9BACT|nr:Crp/Fnr family transcriptional regulator [Flaviaesturariibacter aridisoli]TCZ74952.1 Crp/Fnr family transcriptional regulator [Flaviaesturariibacter aridisoli]
MTPLSSLQAFVHALFPLPDTEWEAFADLWQPFACKRKMLLTAPGETERYLYFVLEGVQRSYYLSPAGKEATIVFTYPHSFSGVADSFLTQMPSRFHFETLTASHFLRAPYSGLSALMHQYPAVQSLVLRTTSFVLRGVLERMAEQQTAGAEEKFRSLLTRSPHLLQLIPHKYLASYLGLDAATFSKLLGTVRL